MYTQKYLVIVYLSGKAKIYFYSTFWNLKILQTFYKFIDQIIYKFIEQN